MTDHSAPPYGWGPPPQQRPQQWAMPLAVVAAAALVAAGLAVGLHPRGHNAAPRPSVTATPPPRAAPQPIPSDSPTPSPTPVRTYSAPADGIAVTGRITDAAGRPVRDASVRIERHQSGFEAFFTALTVFSSLGLACLTDICTVPYGQGRSDGSGRYTVFLQRDTADYDVIASGDGGTYTAKFSFTGRAVRLPDLRLWSPAPRIEVSGTTARIRFASPPASLGAWDHATAEVKLDDTHSLLTLNDARSGDRFDARLIEDARAKLAVLVTVHGRLGVTTYGAELGVHGTLRPFSRGSACIEFGPNNRRTVDRPCALTDGALLTEWRPRVPDWSCGGSPCDRTVAIDLGAVRAVRYVAVRVCDPFFDQVESSADGTHWDVLVAQHSYGGADLDDICAAAVDVHARYVRVRGPAGGFYLRRSEISVF